MKQIWIVDDDEEMTNAIRLLLKLLDYQTTGFLNAPAAGRALLSGKRPDLILLDINMPDVSGLDLLKFLRSRSEWRDLPIVMLSSEADDVTVDRALEIGADGYVMKPVTIEELEKTLHAAFERHPKNIPPTFGRPCQA